MNTTEVPKSSRRGHYADEIRSADEVDRGLNAEAKPAELDLAKRLIADLTQKKFDSSKYHDRYR